MGIATSLVVCKSHKRKTKAADLTGPNNWPTFEALFRQMGHNLEPQDVCLRFFEIDAAQF